MLDTLILGGGISGLLAAHVFGGKGTALIERGNKVGGNYLAGGLKYLRLTTNLRLLLEQLRVPWHSYFPSGALLWVNALHKHPEWMRLLTEDKRREIQKIHWKRTRGSLDGFKDTCMNDPMGEGDAEATRLDHARLLTALEESAKAKGTTIFTETDIRSVQEGWIDTNMGTMPYKRLITTLPLTASRNIFKHVSIPEVQSKLLTVARSKKLPGFLMERGALEFDYIYTPMMSLFHRISRRPDNHWELEGTGLIPEPEHHFEGEITFDNVALIPGHLVPLDTPVAWPSNILALGRFAEWDTRSTAEKSLDRLIAWSQL